MNRNPYKHISTPPCGAYLRTAVCTISTALVLLKDVVVLRRVAGVMATKEDGVRVREVHELRCKSLEDIVRSIAGACAYENWGLLVEAAEDYQRFFPPKLNLGRIMLCHCL